MTENTMREAFEKLALQNNLYLGRHEQDYKNYYSPTTQIAWIAYQSAIAHQNQEAVPIYQLELGKLNWVDTTYENYKANKPDKRRIVYLAPPQPQEVKDALEAAAKVAEHYSLAERIARLTMSNPVTHSINVTKIIADEIRALIK